MKKWSIPCLDATDRDRVIRVALRDAAVAIQTPPGEAAVLNQAGVERLCEALLEAARHLATSSSD